VLPSSLPLAAENARNMVGQFSAFLSRSPRLHLIVSVRYRTAIPCLARLPHSRLNPSCRPEALGEDRWARLLRRLTHSREVRQVQKPRKQDRRATQLERATKRAEPSRQGMAVKAAR
jgi:hypothetical protein